MGRYLSVSQWLRWILSYPMLAWDTHLPNGCFGRRAFPIEAEIRPAAIPIVQNTHTQWITLTWLLVQADFQQSGPLQLCHSPAHPGGDPSTARWRTSTIPAPIHPPTDTSPVPLVWQSIHSRLRRYRSCSRPFLLDQVSNTGVGHSPSLRQPLCRPSSIQVMTKP